MISTASLFNTTYLGVYDTVFILGSFLGVYWLFGAIVAILVVVINVISVVFKVFFVAVSLRRCICVSLPVQFSEKKTIFSLKAHVLEEFMNF